MPWKCFIVERVEDHARARKLPEGGVLTPVVAKYEWLLIDWMDLPVGAMWFQGPLLFVRLPALIDWCIDRAGTGGCRWNRTGEAPNVTAQPSINYVGSYHGYVQNGFVTDDLAGKRYSDFGRLIK